MKILEKLLMDQSGLIENGPITIAAFGDSVTHGAVGPGEINYETVYWNRLRKKINDVRNYVPVNVINAGIGGIMLTTAAVTKSSIGGADIKLSAACAFMLGTAQGMTRLMIGLILAVIINSIKTRKKKHEGFPLPSFTPINDCIFSLAFIVLFFW